MKGPLVKIEIEPNVFVYNNSILRNRHQSPLSASLSVFASQKRLSQYSSENS